MLGNPNSFSEGRMEDSRSINDNLTENKDLVLEQILENINNTPIGRVLKRIATMPEVRQEKILGVRQQLTEGDYEIKDRLDIALDKVLEELTT
ncbi:MAG: hypothetical protein ACYSSI_08410 [Planctomycetota bacterium]